MKKIFYIGYMEMKIELIPIPVIDVDKQPWGNFVYFKDPDGNKWSLQELPHRK